MQVVISVCTVHTLPLWKYGFSNILRLNDRFFFQLNLVNQNNRTKMISSVIGNYIIECDNKIKFRVQFIQNLTNNGRILFIQSIFFSQGRKELCNISRATKKNKKSKMTMKHRLNCVDSTKTVFWAGWSTSFGSVRFAIYALSNLQCTPFSYT